MLKFFLSAPSEVHNVLCSLLRLPRTLLTLFDIRCEPPRQNKYVARPKRNSSRYYIKLLKLKTVVL